MDVLEEIGTFYLKHDSTKTTIKYNDGEHMRKIINEVLLNHCRLLKKIIYSDNPHKF